MRTYWAPRATLPDGVRKRVRLRVEDGIITEVTQGVDIEDGDTVLEGLVRPGFANTHSHAFHRALRGRTHADGGNFWTWREEMYAITAQLDPAAYLSLARAVFAEMVLGGYTVVGEFHYLHHAPGGIRYADPNAMSQALMTAATEAGIRMTLLDTVYLTGGLFATGHTDLDDTQVRFSDRSVQEWKDRVTRLEPTPMIRHGAAIHSVRAVPREHLRAVADYAAEGLGHPERGPAPLHIHLSEQPGENHACEQFYGLAPTGLLAAEGVLGPDLTAVHATHLTDADIAALAETSVCFCPTTERDLADGIGPARALADAGAGLCIGSDQNAVVDPFEEVRAIEMHERLNSLERGRFSIGELESIGTENGYRALGWADGGVLREGALADLIAIRLDGPHAAGADPDQVIFVAGNQDVSDVVIAGEHIVRDGQHRIGPVGPLLATAIGQVTG